MSPPTQTATPADTYHYPSDVIEYADRHAISHGLEPLRQATLRLFPTGTLRVTFEPDPDVEELDRVVYEVTVSDSDVPDRMAARGLWHDEFAKIYPPPYTLKEPLCSLRRR